MEDAEDHAMKDQSKAYCRYCARPDGSMQSYDEKLKGYSGWLMKTQGLAESAALEQSKVILEQLPAWKSIAR